MDPQPQSSQKHAHNNRSTFLNTAIVSCAVQGNGRAIYHERWRNAHYFEIVERKDRNVM